MELPIKSTEMRHLQQNTQHLPYMGPKSLDLEPITGIKQTIPKLFDDFMSDEEMLPKLEIDLKYESDCSDVIEQDLKSEVKKNRRKATTPQRAVQLEINSENSQTGSIENMSESSQDGSKKAFNTLSGNKDNRFLFGNEKLNEKIKNMFDFDNSDILENFENGDVFKDLQEEADGETLDEEIIDNVKEEWKAHWGVKCNMCELVFSFKAEFDEHYLVNYNLQPVYTCSFCNKSAEKYSTFRSHCYRHITEGRYKCQECPKGFSLQSLLHVHILAKHTRAKPYVCEECGKSFVTKPGLKIHLKKHKTETKEDYPCVECGKVLHTRGGLTSHMNVHRLGRRFMCDVCGKTFTQKVNMQQHVKQHTGDKPHECDKCGKTFAEKSHLARHYSFHSDKRPFKCTVCHKMYKTERCLKVHSLVHAAERPFVCAFCNKGFLSSTKLKQHYNIHTGERPYKCKYCERTFTNYPNWLKHTRRRHKVDHKTGVELTSLQKSPVTKAKPKNEASSIPVSLPTPPMTAQEQLQVNFVDNSIVNDQLINDVSLSKAEEMFLQQGLLNFPLLDDKLGFGQQLDLLSANPSTSVGTHYFVPYFQSTLPNQTIIQTSSPSNLLSMPIPLNEFITTNFFQQSCD